jgi:hypothetical protein
MSALNKLKRMASFPAQIVRYNRSRYWQKLPARSYVKFLLAIFLMFSIIGFLNDITSGGRLTIARLILEVLVSGLVAVLWVHSFTHTMRFLPLAVLLMVCNMFVYDLWPVQTVMHDTGARLMLDSFGILVALALSFVFLVQFIQVEGIQHIRLRTEIALTKELHDVLVPIINLKFVLMTDGLTEVCDTDGTEFGVDRIEVVLLKNRQLPLEQLFSTIMKAAADFGSQKDDQTMLLIRCL